MTALASRRVLVTGGTGFIGAHLVRRLLAEKADVHVLVRSEALNKRGRLADSWKRVTRHVGSLDDPGSLENCVRKADPSGVFHLAKDRGGSFEADVAKTMRLADALKWNAPGLSRWVRTAHAAREKFGRKGDAHLARLVWSKYQLPVVTLELSQVYGPGQGDGDFPTALIRDVLAGKKPRIEPGGGVQDFVYVEDVVEAYVQAALRENLEGRTIAIGSGDGRTRSEVAYRLLEKLDVSPSGMGSPRAGARESGEPARLDDARRLLGWEPVTPLDAGLERTIRWVRGAK